jgi:dihydroxyacetone kinase-like predicted kinase
MYQTMNGSLFRAMIDYGIRNLALHSDEINDLNIFPVPDGDTGTNMVTTTRIGYRAIEPLGAEECDLCTVAAKFGGAGLRREDEGVGGDVHGGSCESVVY